jgi:hypothetical protein
VHRPPRPPRTPADPRPRNPQRRWQPHEPRRLEVDRPAAAPLNHRQNSGHGQDRREQRTSRKLAAPRHDFPPGLVRRHAEHDQVGPGRSPLRRRESRSTTPAESRRPMLCPRLGDLGFPCGAHQLARRLGPRPRREELAGVRVNQGRPAVGPRLRLDLRPWRHGARSPLAVHDRLSHRP